MLLLHLLFHNFTFIGNKKLCGPPEKVKNRHFNLKRKITGEEVKRIGTGRIKEIED